MTTFLWLLVLAGGPFLIAVAIAYALMMRRRSSRREKEAHKNATERPLPSRVDLSRSATAPRLLDAG